MSLKKFHIPTLFLGNKTRLTGYAALMMMSANFVAAEDNSATTTVSQSVSTSNYKAGILLGDGAKNIETSASATALYATQIGKDDSYGFQLEGHAGGTNNHAILDFNGASIQTSPNLRPVRFIW